MSAITTIMAVSRSLPFLLVLLGLISTEDCPSPCYCLGTTTYCNRTGITNVPKDLPKNTETLYIGGNPIKSIPKNAFEGLNKLKWLDFTGNKFNESSIESGALDLPSIETLDLTLNSYMTIPKELPPNLNRLYFYYNPINTIRATSFTNHSTIQNLYFTNTNLYSIEEHAFDPLVNAVLIDLGFNKLTDDSFGPMTFAKNQKLTDLGFRFNPLQNVPDTSHFPVTLQSLDFAGTQIKLIPSYAFRSLTNLTSIALWQGQITTLEDNAFFGLNRVSGIDMMENHVGPTITNLTFTGLVSLQTLYLDLNNVSKIETGAFYVTKNIKELWLSSNKLTTLEPSVLDNKIISQLSTLFIDDNPWLCDCHLKWLRQKMDDEPNVIQDPHLIVCSGPPQVAGKAWDVLKPEDFVCKDHNSIQ